MTKKGIYCLALYFHFPQTKSYNSGLFSLISIPGSPSATTWHKGLYHPPSFSGRGAKSKLCGLPQARFYGQHTWRKCDGNRWRCQAPCQATARNIKGNLQIQKLHRGSSLQSALDSAQAGTCIYPSPPTLCHEIQVETIKPSNKQTKSSIHAYIASLPRKQKYLFFS